MTMTPDKPREVTIHQSANRPNQILGGDRELVLLAMLVAVSLAFSLASLWGSRSERGLLGFVSRRISAHGEGRPDDAPDLHAAHPLPDVLPSEERLVLDVPATAEQVEVGTLCVGSHARARNF